MNVKSLADLPASKSPDAGPQSQNVKPDAGSPSQDSGDLPLDLYAIPQCVPMCPPDQLGCSQPIKLRNWLLEIKDAVTQGEGDSLFTKEIFEGARRLFPKEFEGAHSFDFFKRYIEAAASNLYQAHPDCEEQYRKDHPGQEIKIAVLKEVEPGRKSRAKNPPGSRVKPPVSKAPPKEEDSAAETPLKAESSAAAHSPPESEGESSPPSAPPSQKGEIPRRFMLSDDYAFNSRALRKQPARESPSMRATCEAPPHVYDPEDSGLLEDKLINSLTKMGAKFRRRDEAGNMMFAYGRIDFTVTKDGSVVFGDTTLRMKPLVANLPGGVRVPLPGFLLQIGAFDITMIGTVLSVSLPDLEKLSFKGKNQKEKREVLETTHELRFAIFKNYRKLVASRSETYATLGKELDRIWKSPGLTLEQKKAGLFGLWDGCLGGGEEDIIGDTARKIVIDFINKHLPEESHQAYTADELASLNAVRRSKNAFAPYAHTA